jgi:hypothetical protein
LQAHFWKGVGIMSTHLKGKMTDIRCPPNTLGNSRVLYNSVQIAKGKP